MVDIFVSNIFIGNCLEPPYIRPDTKNIIGGPINSKFWGIFNCTFMVAKYSGQQQHLGHLIPLISPINLAQNSNPGTVLESAHPEDSETPPKRWNWPSFA